MKQDHPLAQEIMKDLEGAIRARGINSDPLARLDKLDEEVGEFVEALLLGTLDDIADEGADVVIVIMITQMLKGINPFAALAAKLDEMNLETPWRGEANG